MASEDRSPCELPLLIVSDYALHGSTLEASNLVGILAVLAFGTTLIAAPVVLAILRRLAVLDVPGERSSHLHPTVRGGGLAVGIGAVVVAVAGPRIDRLATIPLIAGLMFAAIGLLDDLVGASPKLRIVLQTAAAAAASGLLVTIISPPYAWLYGVFIAIWLVSFVNAFNFFDGLNGIATLQAIVTGMTVTVAGLVTNHVSLAATGVVVAAFALAFLPFNFPAARMFLGDVGSYAFGGMLGALAAAAVLCGAGPDAVLASLAPCLGDTLLTLVRRVVRGERWYLPHRTHAYQRLTDAGWSHAQVTGFVTLLSTVSAGSAAIGESLGGPARIVADVVVVVIILAYLGLPGWLSGRRRRDRFRESLDPR